MKKYAIVLHPFERHFGPDKESRLLIGSFHKPVLVEGTVHEFREKLELKLSNTVVSPCIIIGTKDVLMEQEFSNIKGDSFLDPLTLDAVLK